MANFNQVKPEKLQAFCIEAMRRAGMKEPDARITAEILVTTDTWGTLTHGTKQLRGLLKNFRDQRMDVNASGEIIAEGTPEQVCQIEASYTGQFLKNMAGRYILTIFNIWA